MIGGAGERVYLLSTCGGAGVGIIPQVKCGGETYCICNRGSKFNHAEITWGL